MLATFVIGLREGLEAALIVGIIAAFLKRNGKPLAPLWWGVGSATVLSVLVGVALMLVERSLPQAAQEGMETVIGAIAVVFVTGMVLWMGKHSRGLKKELETSAGAALGEGTASALALMAFLAVLKEGFETAVFLLATFQAASNGLTASLGALLGILCAVGLGYGLYSGGVSLNLGKFFRWTSVFLVLVAAGLVVSAVHTAHEAGWLDAGQQSSLNLTWLAPAGSVRSALFTGVLGIPARPRLIEVVVWFCYLVPMCVLMFWPQRLRPSARTGIAIRAALAATCTLAALVLALAVTRPTLQVPAQAPLADGGSVTLQGTTLRTPSGSVALRSEGSDQRDGMTVQRLVGTLPADVHLPASLTLTDLVSLSGGRLPIGVTPGVATGPFHAAWTPTGGVQAWTRAGGLVDATADRGLTLTLSGGGLASSRTLTVPAGATLSSGARLPITSWQVDPAHVTALARQDAGLSQRRANATLLGRTLPVLLLFAAAALVVGAVRARRDLRTPTPASTTAVPGHGASSAGSTTADRPTNGVTTPGMTNATSTTTPDTTLVESAHHAL